MGPTGIVAEPEDLAVDPMACRQRQMPTTQQRLDVSAREDEEGDATTKQLHACYCILLVIHADSISKACLWWPPFAMDDLGDPKWLPLSKGCRLRVPLRAETQPDQAREWTRWWSPGSRASVPCYKYVQVVQVPVEEACCEWVCGLRLAEHLIFPQTRQTLEEREASRRRRRRRRRRESS